MLLDSLPPTPLFFLRLLILALGVHCTVHVISCRQLCEQWTLCSLMAPWLKLYKQAVVYAWPVSSTTYLSFPSDLLLPLLAQEEKQGKAEVVSSCHSLSHSSKTGTAFISANLPDIIDTASLICGAGFMKLSGIPPSVCPSLSHHSAGACCCSDFLLWARQVGDMDWQWWPLGAQQ